MVNTQHIEQIFREIVFKPGTKYYLRSAQVSGFGVDEYVSQVELSLYGAVVNNVNVSLTLRLTHEQAAHVMATVNNYSVTSDPFTVIREEDEPDDQHVSFRMVGPTPVLRIGEHNIVLEVSEIRQTQEPYDRVSFSDGRVTSFVPRYQQQNVEVRLDGFLSEPLPQITPRWHSSEKKKEEKKPSRKLNIPGVNC